MSRYLTALLVFVLLAIPVRGNAQNLLAGAGGGVAGMAAGGYLSLALTVADARRGRYLTSMDEFIGWRSAPVLIGGATGAGLGLFDADRLGHTVLYGIGGTAAGLAAGLIIGPQLWTGREARWAGAAIGAGVGMVIGTNIGLFLVKHDRSNEEGGTATARIPITLTFRF